MEERERLDSSATAMRAYLHRQIDPIAVGPLANYLPPTRTRTDPAELLVRLAFGLSATVVLLVAAVVIGAELRVLRGAPLPSSPATSAVSPGPFGLSASYGVVAMTRDGFVVRSETDPAPIRRIEPITRASRPEIAVSRNGRLVAYWRPPGSGDPPGDQLMLYDAATNADPRMLLRLDNNQVGGALVWADNDSGIAFVSMLRQSPSPGPLMHLRIIDIQAGQMKGDPREIATAANSATQLRPLAWIRESATVSAVEGTLQGEAMTYVMASETGAVKRFALRSGDQVVRMDDVVADPQVRMLGYLVTFTCQDGKPGCTLIRFWALEDPQIAAGWQANPGSTFTHVLWVPFTREALVLTRNDRDGSLTLGAWGPSLFGSRQTIAFVPSNPMFVVRPDGTAFFAAAFNGTWLASLYDLRTGQVLSTDLTTTGGGSPAYSVTLQSAEADRISSLPAVSPLLSEAEIITAAQKGVAFGDRLDRITASLDRGTFPFAGRAPTWTVKEIGEFQSIGRGPIPARAARCTIVTFNARTGLVVGIRMSQDEGDCS